MNTRLPLLLVLAAALAGCGVAPDVAVKAPVAAKRAVAAKKADLIQVSGGGKLVAKGQRIALAAEGRKLQAAPATFPYAITYTAQVPAVNVGGDPVQANDVASAGDRAAIAYNTAGDIFAGAIQILDTADPAKPAVFKEIKFKAMDVNAVALVGNTLYFGGAADPEVYGYKAFVGAVDITNVTAAALTAGLRPVPSHAVTSIAVSGGGSSDTEIYVGVGAAGGGVQVFDAGLAPKRFIDKTDVRAIAPTAANGVAGALALSGSTDGGAAELFPVAGPGSVLGITDFKSAYAKATVEVAGNQAFLGLSAAGMQVRDLASGLSVFSLANPEGDARFTTNGVSTDGDLAFVANGEYGFRVLALKDRAKIGADFAEVAGFHRLAGAAYDGKRYSANVIRYKAGQLFVASGLGGVNLYSLTK